MNQGKKNINPIPSTMRGKKRYIKFALNPEKKLWENEVHNALWKHFLEKFGSLGTAKQRLLLATFDEQKSIGILRCSHTSVAEAKAALLEIKEINGIPVRSEIMLVSGTIRKLKEN